MFTVYWFRFPHGIEGEPMKCNSKEFESLQKAIDFLNKRWFIIQGKYWAGGYVEDKRGTCVYEYES